MDDNIYRLIMLLLWNRREDVTVSTLHSIVMKLLSESCSRTNIHRQTLKLVQIVILRRNGNDAMSLVQMCVDEIRSMVALDETPGSDGVSVVRYSASMLGHRRRELLVFLVELVCSIRQEHISEPSALVAFDRCLGLCGELSLEVGAYQNVHVARYLLIITYSSQEIVSLHAIVAALLAKLSNYSDAVMRAVIVLQVMTVRTFRYDEKLTCKLLQQLIGLVRQFGSSFVTQDERFWEQVMQGLSGTRKLLKWTSAAYAFMVIQATGSIPDVVNDRFKTIVDALGRSASRHDSRLSVALRSQHSQATADVTVIDEVLGAIHAGDDTPSNHVGQSLDNDSIERDFCLTEHGSLESANLDFRIK